MGLAAAAYYLERTEAVVAQSVLLDAGILAIIGNEDMLRLQPWYTLEFGGYRVLVSDFELDDAVAVLVEARANPLLEGERLKITANVADRFVSLVLGWFAGGTASPVGTSEWVDLQGNDARET